VNRYENQVVLITGGAQGLGAAVAHRFVAEGAVVAIGDINEDSANSLAKQIQNEFHKDCLSQAR
jgi:3-oxoacyl-[acyl-carrier protein] reductase